MSGSRSLFFWKRLWIMTQCHICYLLTLTIMLIISHDTLFMSKHPQTSVDSAVEESALKTFVVFERGDSGDLTFNQFKKVKPWHVLVWWSGVLVMFHRFLPFWLFLPVSPVSNQIHLFSAALAALYLTLVSDWLTATLDIWTQRVTFKNLRSFRHLSRQKESSLLWCQGRLQCLHLNLNWVFCAGSWTARNGAETRRGANFFPNFLFWILWILWPCSCEPNMLFMFSTIFRVLICFSEFVRCHKNDDAQLKSNKVRRLFREVDEDGNGKVDFEEFLGLVGQRSKTKEVNSMNGGGGGFPNRWSSSFIFVFLCWSFHISQPR